MIGYSCFLVSSWNFVHQYGMLFGMKVCNKYSATFRFLICPSPHLIVSIHFVIEISITGCTVYQVSWNPELNFEYLTNKNCKNSNKLVSCNGSTKWFKQPNEGHQNNYNDWLLLNFNFSVQPLPHVRARKSFLIGGLGVTPHPLPTQKRPTEWRKLLSPYYHHKTLSVARWSPVN